MKIFFPLNLQKKVDFCDFIFYFILCFTFSIENFLVNLYRGENNFFLHVWCCNFHILDPLMLAEYSPSINPKHEQVRACAQTPKPEPEHHQKHRASSKHVLGPIPSTNPLFWTWRCGGGTDYARDSTLNFSTPTRNPLPCKRTCMDK